MNTSITKLATSTTSYGVRAVVICLTLVIVGISFGAIDSANAQPRVRTYARTDVERFIKDVERSSQDFQRAFDAWLDRSRLDGRPQEDIFNRQVQELTSALSNLRSNFNSRNDWWPARRDMQRVLNAANDVNNIMGNRGARGGLNRQWNALRANLNTLANAFNLPQVGTTFGGIQTYPGDGGNVRACTMTGTYRAYTNAGEIELSIASNGTATARSLTNGSSYSGRCANDVLYFDWGTFNVVREGRNNIAVVEMGNQRNRTIYRRVGGSGDVVATYPTDQYGNVPSWAVGTFRGMTNDGEAEITIRSDGVATARSLVNNAVFNGGYANNLLTFDWGSFRLVNEGGGIRAVRVGERTGILYQRVTGYPGDTGPTYPSQYGNLPNWAVGRFRGMTNDGEAELTIGSDGNATVRSLTTNQVFSGRFANDVLTFDWGSFRLVRGNGGITLVEVGKQSGLFYRRID